MGPGLPLPVLSQLTPPDTEEQCSTTWNVSSRGDGWGERRSKARVPTYGLCGLVSWCPRASRGYPATAHSLGFDEEMITLP